MGFESHRVSTADQIRRTDSLYKRISQGKPAIPRQDTRLPHFLSTCHTCRRAGGHSEQLHFSTLVAIVVTIAVLSSRSTNRPSPSWHR